MKSIERVEMYNNILKHGQNLNNIFNTGIEPIALCKKLHRLEKKANRIATDWCNGVIQSDDIEKHTQPILKAVDKILKSKYIISFNGDARGYSLKIDSKIVRENNLTIHRDMGGNGILAPDFTPNN
jgi:hypothetical protein